MTDPALLDVLDRTRVAVGIDTLSRLIERHAPAYGLTFDEATDGRIDWPSVAPFGPRGEVDEQAVVAALREARR